jgi:cysteinyl-tRNA synthetase
MWFHPSHLFIEGAKMSKSKGNFYTQRDLFAKGIEPAALRLELIRTHYRSNANFTLQGLADSQRMVERWRRFASACAESKQSEPVDPDRARAIEQFRSSLNEDLNIAGAIGAINTWINAETSPSRDDGLALAQFDAVLGILEREQPKSQTTEIGLYLSGLTPDPAVEAKLAQRRAARAAKDFATSDKIRDELAAMGLAIKDVAGGKVEVSRK